MVTLAGIAPESILLAGAGRAILLQIAHPAIGYGVARHSDFANRPMDRLHGTLTYIYALSNGTPDDVAAVRRAVNRAHGPVSNPPRGSAHRAHRAHGVELGEDAAPTSDSPRAPSPQAMDAGDPPYDAFDPQLQLWVAATLYDTAVLVYERVFGPLGDEEAERVYREYAVLGTALQMPAELWPADRAAFRRYWDETVAGLRVDDTIRGVAAALLKAERAPLPIRAGMPLARFATVALLPDAVRAQFGYPWSVVRQRRFDRLLAAIGAVYRVLPPRIRHWPQRYYLARLRRARPRP
ncbi:oxygenase MpaB family protein [Herbiconiux solani]|uniref:oxygenase MpaB family protein n=1 Tax=Herbiconiux solani TaxID=661329 RepID=UPI0008256390|nr:oxygenase MpaB family protein [Herbiconiux solani]